MKNLLLALLLISSINVFAADKGNTQTTSQDSTTTTSTNSTSTTPGIPIERFIKADDDPIHSMSNN